MPAGATWTRRYLSAILAASIPTHLSQPRTIVTSASESKVKRGCCCLAVGSSRSITASIRVLKARCLFESSDLALHHKTHRPHSYRNRLKLYPSSRGCRRCLDPRYAFRWSIRPGPGGARSRLAVTLSYLARCAGPDSTRSTFQA